MLFSALPPPPVMYLSEVGDAQEILEIFAKNVECSGEGHYGSVGNKIPALSCPSLL